LKYIPGTGYSWHMESIPDGILEMVGEEILPSERRDVIVGGTEFVLWKFRAKGQGTGIMRLLYYRTWEGPGNASEEFEITVSVS
jgi:predicted secreted protein